MMSIRENRTTTVF
jgi:hypothetical protein